MATNSRDINLVIKARDEATRGIESVTAALNSMFSGQEQVAGSAKNAAAEIARLAAADALLAKATGAVIDATDRGEASFRRVSAAADEQRAKVAALKDQYEAARQVIERLSSAEAVVGAGRNQSARIADIERVRAASEALSREINKEQTALERLEGQLRPAASALQQLASTEIAAKDARVVATAQIEMQTEALRQQAAEAQRVSGIQARINALTGVNRPALFDGSRASQSAAILAEADAIFRQGEARAAHAAKVQAENAALAEQARIQAALERSTGLGRVSATEASGFNPRTTGLAAIAEKDAEAIDRAAAELREMDQAVDDLRNSLSPLARLQAEYERQMATAQRLYRERRITLEELSAAQKKYAQDLRVAEADMKRNGREGVGLFGLRPYEVTNLSFQINDLFTQVASGTSLMQAMAQQGGQILQLFPGIASRIVALLNPATAALAVTLGAVALGVKELADEAERLRKFEGLLASIGDGAKYSAAGLEANVQAARRMGVAADDAVASLTTFVQEGLNPARFNEFTEAAKDLAAVLGVDVPDAAKMVADAFTGGYDAIVKLDEATGFLTVTQRDHIRALFEEGRAHEARAYAFDLFSDKMDAGADKMRGPWADAARELGNAWQDVTKWFSDRTWVKGLFEDLDSLGGRIARLIRQMRGIRAAADIQADIDQVAQNLRDLNVNIGLSGDPLGLKGIQVREYEARIRELQAELKKAQTEASSAPKSNGDTRAQGVDPAEVKRRRDELEIEEKRERAARLKGAARVAEAGEAAYRASLLRYGDEELAQREKKLAISREQKKVDEEAAREAKKADDERERRAKQTRFLDPVTGRVSSGFGPRTAPKAGASTFHRGVDYAVPVGTAVRAPAGGTILEVGVDAKLGKFVYIDHGNRVVSKFGHLSDTSGLVKGQRVEAGQVVARSGNTGNSTGPHLHYQVEVGGKPVDPRKGMFPKDGPGRFEINGADAAQNYQEGVDKAEQDRAKNQSAFNDAIDAENLKRQQSATLAERQRGLSGEALVDAQREAEVQRELEQRRAEAKAKELQLTKEQEESIRRAVELEFEQTRGIEARRLAREKEANDPVDRYVTLRRSLQEQLEAAQNAGNTNLAGTIGSELDTVNEKLDEAINKAIAFWEAIGGPEAETQIARLKGIQLTVGDTGRQFLMSAKQINESIANGAAKAFDQFAKNIAEGQNVFKSLKDAFLQFAADFLRQIAQMIIQQAIFNAVSAAGGGNGAATDQPGGAGGGGGAGAGASILGWLGKLFHTGGVVDGGGGHPRTVNPSWFRTAAEYHTGGIVGLAADEVPAILRKNEEVLTREDPRHRYNGGMSGGGGETRVINVFDSAAALEAALATPLGGRAILNWVRDNPRAFKAAMEG